MTKRMSCRLTQPQVRNRTKTCTRRDPATWVDTKPGHLITLIEQGQGLKLGQKQVVLDTVRCLQNYLEPLAMITQQDVIAEGFPDWTPEQFIEFYCREKGGEPVQMVRIIRWEYLEDEKMSTFSDESDPAPKEGSIQIVFAERPSAETQLEQVLSALSQIDEQIPAEAKLPGSPKLTDQMAHLLRKYNELKAELSITNERADDLQSAVNRAIFLLGIDSSDWSQGEAGIEAAVKSNLQIGIDRLKTREDWCDDDFNLEGTITERLFLLTQRAVTWKQAAKDHRHNEHCWYDWWSFTAKLYADEHKQVGKLREALQEANQVFMNNWGVTVDFINKALDESKVKSVG